MQALHLAHDECCLVLLCPPLIDDDGITRRIIGPEILLFAGQIVLDDRICRCKNILCRAVVLFEQDHRRVRIIALEVQDVAHIRTAPAVDGLICITDDTDIAVSRGKQLRNCILRAVRILIFVHKNVLKLLLILCSDFLVVGEQFHRQHQQIVEIKRVVRAQFRLVELIHLCHLLRKEIGSLGCKCLDIEEAILCI